MYESNNCESNTCMKVKTVKVIHVMKVKTVKVIHVM